MGVMDRYNEKNKKKKEEVSGKKTTSMGVAERFEKNKYYQSLGVDSVDDIYINTFISDISKFFGSVSDGSISYNDATSRLEDLSTRYDTIQGWLNKNKSRLDDETYNSLSSTFNGLKGGFDQVKNLYSQWKSDDHYFKNAQSARNDRLKWYDEQKAKVAELENEYKTANSTRKKEITAEMDSINAETRLYERGENGWTRKYLDDTYSITEKEDFESGSANRNFENISREQLDYYDAMMDTSQWHWDADGNQYDAFGNKLDHSNVDERGILIHPNADQYKVTDRYGMWKNATEDDHYTATAMREQDAWNSWANAVLAGDDYHWDRLTEDEVNIYYYLLNTQGADAASAYLDNMEVELAQRETSVNKQEWTKNYDEAGFLGKVFMNAASVPASVFGNAVALLDDSARQLRGEELNPYNGAHTFMHYSNTVRGLAAEDLDQTGFKLPVIDFSLGDIYQVGMSRLDSALATSVFGGAGTFLLGAGAATNEAYRLYQQGASEDQILLGAFSAGAAETLFEYASFDKLVKMKDAKKLRQWIKSALIQGGIEASEEGFTEISNILTNAFIMRNESDWAELIEEKGGIKGAIGAATMQTIQSMFGGFLGGVGAGITQGGKSYIANQAATTETGRAILDADGGYDALQKLSYDVANKSDNKTKNALTRQAKGVSGKTATGNGLITNAFASAKNTINANKAGRLYTAAQEANNKNNAAANKADIVKSLSRNDIYSETAEDIADALVAKYNGQDLTRAQEKLLEAVENDKDVQDAIRGIVANEKSTIGQRSQNIRKFNSDIYSGLAVNAMKENVVKSITEKEFTPTGEYTVSNDGKTTAMVTENVDGKPIATDTGDVINIKGIKEISNGKIVLDIGDGNAIDAKDVSYANENDAIIYEAIANLGDKVDAKTANKLIAKYNGGNALVYARGMTQAYTYGFYGIDRTEMAKKNALTTELTPDQRNLAYSLGEEYRSVKDSNDKAKAAENLAKSKKSPSEKGVYYRDKDGNATDIDTYLKDSNIKLNDMQKTGIEAMQKMSKMMGVRFNVFESWVENGKHYYLDADGNVVEGNPNGFYDTTTGDIYIDLKAGNDYQGTMLFTVAHEVTHFMRQWSPEHFTKLAKIVFQHGGMKGSVSELIALKQAKAEAKGRSISYDVAMEEVVADGMETILKDGKVVEFMADVKKQDYAAWQKLKSWFENLATFLKKMVAAYSGQTAQTVEGAKVAEFSQNLLNQIEKIFAEGAVEAGDSYRAADANFQAAEKNTTEDGVVKMQTRSVNGEQVVWIEENILKDNKGQPAHQFIADYIAEHIGDVYTIIESGQNVYIGEDLPGEYTQSKYTKAILRNNPSISKAKNRASANLGEMIEIATNRRWEKTKHTGSKDAKYGMYRYDTRFGFPVKNTKGEVVGANIYNAELLIRNASDGKKYLYDIVSIKKDIASSGWLTQRVTSAAGKPAGQKGDVSTNNVAQDTENVKYESAEALDIEVDAKTESVAPSVMNSERTWTESDYVQERDQAAKEIAKAIGVSEKKAKAYIDSVSSIAKMIAEDRVRLDYFSSPGRSSFVSNVEYGGSFDFSTLCKKRRLLTGTFTAIQKALPNTALTADEILKIRNRMKDAGLEVSCGLCYVEGSRANMGQFAKEFLKLYKQYYPDAWQPNMADVNTPDGIEWVRINHPECYEQYEYFWNHYGTLKPGDKNLFASQQKPKLYQLHTEYKGEVLDKFKDDSNVEEKNLNGGIRLQSFSDFEIVHLIDTMQIIMDMSRVGLAGQAYTKVPDFAWALGDTGLKINLSLIAKGVDENGKLIFDDVEGMPIDEAMKLRDRYSKNVGTILVAFNDEQLLAAMADERVDFIIPFHRSQWKKSQYAAMGLPAKTKDYTYMQNEKFIKPQYHEYRGRMVKDKATNYMPNEYWDFSKSGKENAEAYLEMCARNNKRPKFYKFLQNNGDGSYSLKADGSTDGYWKLLIDFKMYDNEGNGSPQMAVKPEFNMEEANRMLNDYKGGHSNFPVAQGIVDEFVQEYKDSHEGAKFSMRESVEETNDLLAYHNITPQLLNDVLSRNSLLMPSLAITNKGMTAFGEISLLFDKATIDPILNKLNKLYGADAWTPTQTELKKNAKFDTNKTVRAVNMVKNRIGSKFASELFDVNPKQFKDTILKADGSIYNAYAHNLGMQTAYAMEQGIISKIPTNKDGTLNRTALEEMVSKELDTDNVWRQYKKWLRGISDDIITSYDRASNQEILNDMKAQPATAKTFKLSETGELVVPAVEYSSIDEARKNKNRLSENAAEATKAVADEFLSFAKKIGGNTKSVVDAINATFANRYSTADIVKSFSTKGIKITTDTAGELQSLYKKAVELPTQYFEAKPGREVGLDEIKAVVMPTGTEYAELKSKLEELGISVVEYDGSKESRVEALNSMEDLKFSDRDSEGNQLSKAQQEFFKDSQVRWGENLMPVHHGTRREFTVFDATKGYDENRVGGLLWAAKDYEYAKDYSYSDDPIVMKGYLNITNLLDIGDIDSYTNYEKRLQELADLVKLTPSELEAMVDYDFKGLKIFDITSSKGFRDRIVELGYDGVTAQESGLQTFGFVDSNQFKNIDNLNPTSDPDIRYQDRADESVSNRSLLANAFEGLAKDDIEKNKIKEYKGKIDLINAEEKKLSELNAKIKELSFAKGPRDAKAIRDLQLEARQAANRINTYDKQLLRLEASKPLQDVLAREKQAAYKKAEQRGKDALNAYKERAAKTQRELLEKWQESRKKGIESREKTVMKHKIQRVVGELNQLLLNGDKTRHVPENLKKAVADALSLVNMDTVGAEERAAKYAALIAKETDPDKIDAYTVTMENILRQGDKMGQRLKDLRDAYEEIQNSDDPDIANAYDPVIAASLKELSQSIGNTPLRNMTIEQLSDVYDMYKMVLTRVRDANKSFLNDKKEAISSLASRVVGEVKQVGGEHKYRAAFLDFAKKFGWDNLKPVYAFEHIGSSTLKDAFNNVRAGEDVWAVDVTEARQYYLDKSKKYGYDTWDFKKKHRFESASDLEFELTLDQILSLYAYSKREQSLDHLRLGGFVFDSNIETYKDKGSKLIKYKVNTADAHQITPEILANITGLLTNEQKAFVDEMQDYLSTVMGAKGNEVTMQMYGVKLFKEKFYFPLKSAKQFMFEQNEVSGEVKIKNSGFTNKVVAKANNPVILNNFMDVWAGHVNDMSMYHSFVLPLEDFNRIFNYNSQKQDGVPSVSVKGTIQNAYSPAAVNYVRQLITDLNGGARTDSTTGIINKMIGLFKKGSVFASLSVVVQQPSAIARAAALVDTKYFIGPKVDHKRHKALWDEVKQYAPVAIIKEMGYFDTNMGKSTQDFITGKEYSGFKEKMKALVSDSNYRDEVLSKAPALADEIAWCGIWEAVKRETQAKNPGMDVKSEAFLKMVGKRFTEVITKTQVYDSVLSRSGMMRSKDTGMKMATAFMAEPTTSINMIADALLQGKRGNRKYCRTTIGAVIASQLLNSILVSFVYAGRDDDEEETYPEKYIGTLAEEALDSLNPAAYIPFIKDIVSIVKGYDVERSDMAVISDLWKAWESLSSNKVSPYRKVENFAGSIAQIFGLPLKNIMRDLRAIYQTIIGQ